MISPNHNGWGAPVLHPLLVITAPYTHATVLAEQLDHIPAIDLVDAIIEEQINHGGEIRILPNGTLERFGGIALKPRY